MPHKNSPDRMAQQYDTWAKERGVQVLKSKKADKDEETPKDNKFRRKQKKGAQEKTQEEENPNKLTHTIFVENIFDSLKTVPPASVEDLEKTIE